MHHEGTGAPGERRFDRGVLELDLGVLDGGAVGGDRGIERFSGRNRLVQLIAGCDAAIGEILETLRLRSCVGRLGRVARLVGLGLLNGSLIAGLGLPPIIITLATNAVAPLTPVSRIALTFLTRGAWLAPLKIT
jgi:hypothetical protein